MKWRYLGSIHIDPAKGRDFTAYTFVRPTKRHQIRVVRVPTKGWPTREQAIGETMKPKPVTDAALRHKRYSHAQLLAEVENARQLGRRDAEQLVNEVCTLRSQVQRAHACQAETTAAANRHSATLAQVRSLVQAAKRGVPEGHADRAGFLAGLLAAIEVVTQ